MQIDTVKTRQYLKEFNFQKLFIEELGWDHCTNSLTCSVNSQDFNLIALAEKRGMVAFMCHPANNGTIPDYTLRRKIEQQAAKSVHEHIIIYIDDKKTTQIWQWVKREMGKPVACREHPFHIHQPGDSLIQKLQMLAISLEEEESITIVDVAGKTRSAFDVEKITKKFYDRFKKEHDDFMRFINGIPDEEMHRWYASVMLNRLMFIYFIQKKGFLDGNEDYLRNRQAKCEASGKDLFYRNFLYPLFFEGFAKKEGERSSPINKLLGKVPHLNGGLFLKHQVEEHYGVDIQIADRAFIKLFYFFDQYQWHLDERPLRTDNEINPDVLGYIFEKYINQKQMGAYYTKEDITEYISKNTIIPFLFDAAQQKCRISFEGEQSIWKLLQLNPDRYIYEAVYKGVDLPLPEEIIVGLRDISKRTEWNKPAPQEYALPTEIWREVVARRKRYEEIKTKALNGEITSINDFITYNLNIRQFAQDVIENCEGPELLRAFWHAIIGKIPEKSNEKFENGITILDPTCGSGAFLFAALNILEPLYEACLDRMEVFLEELEWLGEKHRSDKYGDFRKILKKIEEHPNRRYFILKSIIINNLFGVDIMEEAIEICKLRLFLKLVAQVEEVEKIEPLPDIDFNIRVGNTLVGFTKLEDVKHALSSQLFSGDYLKRIEEKAEEVDSFFGLFRQMQTEQGMDSHDFSDVKQEVSKRLKALDEQLNGYLAESYGVDLRKKQDRGKWLSSHKPFHWLAEFYGILKHDGFDVIIGNPPYVEYSQVKETYKVLYYATEDCGNLYAFVWERSARLANAMGRIGLIIPVSSVSTEGYSSLRNIWINQGDLVISSFNDRPGKLFAGLEHIRLAVVLLSIKRKEPRTVFTTTYSKWFSEARDTLFDNLMFVEVTNLIQGSNIPKLGATIEASLLSKSQLQKRSLQHFTIASRNNAIFYTRKLSWFVQILDFVPSIVDETGAFRDPSELKKVAFQNRETRDLFLAVLNSSFFYWLLTVWSDCRNLNKREIYNILFDADKVTIEQRSTLCQLVSMLMKEFKKKSKFLEANYEKWGKMQIQCIYPRQSKSLLDRIDRELAKHYGFTDEELDFIINYDIKYRMGKELDTEE